MRSIMWVANYFDEVNIYGLAASLGVKGFPKCYYLIYSLWLIELCKLRLPAHACRINGFLRKSQIMHKAFPGNPHD